MPHRIKILIFIILFAASLFSRSSEASEMMNKAGITIWADILTHDMENDTYRAKGNVMIIWNGVILIADNVTLMESTGEAVAEGGVRLVKGGDVLYCDRITVNLITEKGEVVNGNLFSRKSNFHIQGEKIEKIGEDKYHLDHGTFTVCNGESPSWKFSADDIDVTLEDFAVGKNAVFYIKDIPVLYTPYMLFPVKRERQSGFLFPRIGNSNKKGFNFNIPYYWAISPSQEAEFALDVQSKRGAGFSIDYNWKRPMESFGRSHGYYIYDFNLSKGRGNLALEQQEWVSPSLALKSDINLVTDRDFFRDFADASGEYNRQILDSSISLTKNWQNFSLAGETRYVDDLDVASNSKTLQKLPNIGFTAIRQRINGLPLYMGLDSSFVNFYHDNGVRGQRADIHPFAAVYFPVVDGVDLSAWGGYRERLYNAYEGESGNGSRGIGLADAGVTVAGSMNRVYETDWGSLRRVQHTLVPEVSYSLVEEKAQDYLPAFDFNDRVPGQSMTSWALTNFIAGKFQEGEAPPEYRDLLYLRLSQGYQLRGTRRDLLTLVDDGRHFTDIRIEANFSPLKEISFFTDSRFNTYRTHFSTIMTGFDLKDETGDLAGMSYHYSRNRTTGPFSAKSTMDPDPADTSATDQVNYLEGKFRVGLVKPFIFNSMIRYSFDKGGWLETSYSLEYKHQCWSVALVYNDRPVTGDRAFMINFVLSGVGPLGKYKAF